MSFIEKVTAAAKVKKDKKAKPVKSPRTLAFDYFETEDRLKKTKNKDSEIYKKLNKEIVKLRKELDKNNIGHQKLAQLYQSYLKGKTKVVSENTNVEAGFDLTEFKTVEDFKKILKLAGITSLKPKKDVDARAFVWQGNDILIYTGADPIAGVNFAGSESDEAYASYIGLTGSKPMVTKVFNAIKKIADYKDANPTEREYI
jgi:hypothetical protein